MNKDFVIFYSPGTIVAETSILEIDSWDVQKAMQMARSIKERHGATPYGFCFITKSRTEFDLDSKETARSKMYFLGGTVYTQEEVIQKFPSEQILIGNMKRNNIKRVIVNMNSWKVTLPFDDNCELLSWEP